VGSRLKKTAKIRLKSPFFLRRGLPNGGWIGYNINIVALRKAARVFSPPAAPASKIRDGKEERWM
jgi:hypothetical protein